MLLYTFGQIKHRIGHKVKYLVGRTSGRIPLRLMIVVPFVLQITGAVGIVGFLSFRNGQAAITTIVGQLQQEIHKQVDSNLENYLAIPKQINQTSRNLVSSGVLNMQDLQQWRQFLWHQVQINPSVSIVMASNVKREHVYATHQEDGSINVGKSDASTDFNLYNYAVDAQGNPTGKPNILTKNFDPPNRPYYRDAVAAGRPIWSEIYPNLATNVPQISASIPIYDANQQLLGVTATNLSLATINDFLNTLNVGKNGKALIIERNKRLIATSTAQKSFQKEQGKLKRLTISDINEPAIQLAARYLEQQFPDFRQITKPVSLQFRANNENYFLKVSPFGNSEGLDWLTVVILPESDFMGQIQANTQITFLSCLVALLVATWLGFITTRWISKPIEDLKNSAMAISEGDFTFKVDLDHRSDEIGVLARVFNTMALELQELFTNLEAKVSERTIELEETLQELKRTQSMILQTEKMSSLGQMVAGVAHEINNPVNFIHGNITHSSEYVDNLLELVRLYQKNYPQPSLDIAELTEEIDLDFITEDLPKTLDSMRNGTDRIKQIVLSLRNFSRLDENGKKSVDLHIGIDSTLLILGNRLQPTTTHPEISVVRDYGKLPLVECDPGQLNQVFLNIFNNAVDAINERYALKSNSELTSEILISTRSIENEAGKWAEIRIADNGIGISAEIRENIFDPFFTTKPVGKGTGLGLTSCYQIIVEKHGGTIEANPRDICGTEIILTIPVRIT